MIFTTEPITPYTCTDTLWCIAPKWATGIASFRTEADQLRGYEITETGVAVIRLVGILEKGQTRHVRSLLRNATEDPQVDGILLVIDSPGGTVAGTADLAASIRSAAKAKPVHAFVEDLTASAAYWAASQAAKVFANTNTAIVGSIGTYAVLVDSSAMADRAGIKVHVVRAGEHKGAGVPGTQVTQSQLDHTQHLVDAINGEFVKAVAVGRRMSATMVRHVADGRLHTAADAVRLRLVDGIQSIDKTIQGLGRRQ
jgi:protease-4